MTINSGAAKALESTFIDSDPQTVLLEAFADKIPAVRQSTIGAVKAFVSKTNLWATALALPTFLKGIKAMANVGSPVKSGVLPPSTSLSKALPSDRQAHAGYRPSPRTPRQM